MVAMDGGRQREPVGTYEMLGESVGLAVVGALVVGLVVGFELGFKHPLVVCTSATMASLHCPLISLYATQKKAPPLHANSALL